MNRNPILDVFKGILIFCVVVGHTINSPIIYQFHMPLFFLCGGIVFKPPKKLDFKWFANKCVRFYLPYFAFYFILTIVGLVPFNYKQLIYLLYGGRVLSHEIGVWWFTSCMFATNIIVAFLVTKYKIKTQIICIIILYILAFFESKYLMPDSIQMSILYKYPMNLDVCLLSVPLFWFGYILKDKIVFLEHENSLFYIMIFFVILFELCIYKYHFITFDIDMKYSKYSHPVLFPLVVLAWGIIIYKISFYISKKRIVNSIFVKFGQLSYPIMFLHVPIIYFLKNCSIFSSFQIIIITVLICFLIALLISYNSILKEIFVTGNFPFRK